MLEIKSTAPTIMIIFGGSGDLTKRKLIPALYNLHLDERLPEHFAVIGLGRTEFSNTKYRNELEEGMNEFSRRGEVQAEEWNSFKFSISYEVADLLKTESYNHVAACIEKIEKDWGEKANLIFYLAIGPSLFDDVVVKLGESGICKNISRSRLVIEKPFGHDLESAKELNQMLTNIFDEKQIYRIDHYLGKEAVQNMLVFRFANILFEPIWNRNYIEHIQITASETVGVGDRGGYYNKSGALKDMIQNHVMQLICFIAMEAPVSFKADEIRNRKTDVIRAIRKYEGKDVFKHTVRGQYGRGWMKGEEVKGYREENKVPEKSSTETFAAVKFYIDNWRWQDVPFYVRSGKRMTEKATIIIVQFRQVPHHIFPSHLVENFQPNRIIISISPDTGIKLSFQAKQPGLDMSLSPVDMKFNYSQAYDSQPPEAYETLLYDVMTGDATLFMRADEVEAAWEVIMPIVKAWEASTSVDFPNYAAGTWGPEAAKALIAKDGFHWLA